MLVKADLRRKAETLAQMQSAPPQLLHSGCEPAASTESCKKRGCAAAAPCSSENRPPLKRPFFPSLFPTRTPTRKYNSRMAEEANLTPYTRILRSRQPSPPRSPASTPRSLRGKYWELCSFGRKIFIRFCKHYPEKCFLLYNLYTYTQPFKFIQLFQSQWWLWPFHVWEAEVCL